MSRRHLLAAAAALLLASGARAQEAKKEATPAADPKVAAAIQAAVEKAKQEIREEVRAELQGAQAAAAFLGTADTGPKLEFLELDGYLRLRAQLRDVFDLGRGPDASGRYVFPRPIMDPNHRSTLSDANMRLRLEPTLNVSEHVRVRAQLDLLDNSVLGSSTGAIFDGPGSPYPVPLYGSSRVPVQNDPRVDRAPIAVKRAWAEVETPVGLLSFGRMPSAWGLGMVAHAGGGLDDDLGDTADRIQFATLPVTTPAGQLTFVPMLDFDAEGVLNVDPSRGYGSGQPLDADSGDDARTFALKVVRLDTDAELSRALERGESSFNYGAYYQYKTQRYVFPGWVTNGFSGNVAEGTEVARKAYGHVLDLWLRYRTQRFHLEAELAGLVGQVGNPTLGGSTALDSAFTKQLLLRQFGAVLRADYQIAPNKFTLGGEVGLASGDRAPGFGNRPDVLVNDGSGGTALPPYGSLEGPQWGRGGDHDIRNFRFNPGYKPDLILWSQLLGGVTDGWYLKPTMRWDILAGLALDAQLVYSQAMYSESTPSSVSDATTGALTKNGLTPLGLELDTKLSYTGDDGFSAWLAYGVLQPLDGFNGAGSTTRAHFLQLGLVARF
jgi:uncharacterized protein (TIGR04551 family)